MSPAKPQTLKIHVGIPRPKLSVASVYWTYTDSVHWVDWWHTGHTLTPYTGPLVIQCIATLWLHRGYPGSTTVYAQCTLQCMPSVHTNWHWHWVWVVMVFLFETPLQYTMLLCNCTVMNWKAQKQRQTAFCHFNPKRTREVECSVWHMKWSGHYFM